MDLVAVTISLDSYCGYAGSEHRIRNQNKLDITVYHVRNVRSTSLYVSLTSCAPTMWHLRLALSRRGWSMRSTVRGGPSFWPCAGRTHTHTCCRRSLLQSLSLRWPKPSFQISVNYTIYTDCMHGLRVVLPSCLCRSCTGVYQMILGCWELWKTWFLTWRKSSNYSTFPLLLHVKLWCFTYQPHLLYLFFFFCSSEEAKSTKKVFPDYCS